MQKVIIHSQNHIRFINEDEILFCKSDDCYTHIYLANREELLVTKSLAKLSKELDSKKFVRTNQSHLINASYVLSIDKRRKQIELFHNFQIPYTTTLKELLILLNHGNGVESI